jgi:DnaJ-domain-containing protein 1
MMARDDIRRLLHRLAAHPVLPPADQLPPNGEALHALLADLAAGERSSYAELLRSVAEECGLAPDELAHRAEFLLACLVLPRAGTHYELLGVASTASPEEIRRRWAALIQRYHPDHLGERGGWLADQARRLIDAYQTLRDPDRRRRYDAELARQRAASAVPRPGRSPGPPRPQRWRWVPAVLLLLGAAALLSYARRTPPPLPQVALPPAPKLLEARQQAVFADTLALARSPKPSAPAVEEASGPASVSSPRGGQASLPAPPPRPIEAPALVAAPEHKPAEAPRPAAKPQKSPPPAARPVDVAAAPSSAPRQAQHDVPAGMAEDVVVRPERAATPVHPEVFDAARPESPEPTVRPQPMTGHAMAQDMPLDAVQGGLARGQASPPPERASELRPLAVQPLVAHLKPDGSRPASSPAAGDALALIEAFRTAYEGKDLEGLMRLFAGVPRERDAVGRAAVQELYARNFAALDAIQYELGQLTTSPAAGGALIVQGRFRIRAVRRDNPAGAVHATGAIRWVLRPEAQALRIAEIDYELSRP